MGRRDFMTAEEIITLVILCICAIPFLGLGIAQCKSSKPVGFWSGKKPPEAEQIRDVEAYNKKHGRMWIIYGVGLILAYFLGRGIGNDWGMVSALLIEVIGGLFVMIWYHNKLDKEYLIK